MNIIIQYFIKYKLAGEKNILQVQKAVNLSFSFLDGLHEINPKLYISGLSCLFLIHLVYTLVCIESIYLLF